ncbi:MAG: hypothetical protein MUE38_09245, partial [Flavihumibacter sp.]|nr:hypothetical protein [Flavihumibacter sp.]
MKRIGQISCYLVFISGIVYAGITAAGLLSLESPDTPIADPYFSIMEMLSILIALLMGVCLVAIHYSTLSDKKFYSLLAVLFMFVTICITSIVHFLILSLSTTPEALSIPWHSFLFSFKWPSVVYTLDILAWDLFFGLSMIFLSGVFERRSTVRYLLLLAGIISLVGLIGI